MIYSERLDYQQDHLMNMIDESMVGTSTIRRMILRRGSSWEISGAHCRHCCADAGARSEDLEHARERVVWNMKGTGVFFWGAMDGYGMYGSYSFCKPFHRVNLFEIR